MSLYLEKMNSLEKVGAQKKGYIYIYIYINIYSQVGRSNEERAAGMDADGRYPEQASSSSTRR